MQTTFLGVSTHWTPFLSGKALDILLWGKKEGVLPGGGDVSLDLVTLQIALGQNTKQTWFQEVSLAHSSEGCHHHGTEGTATGMTCAATHRTLKGKSSGFVPFCSVWDSHPWEGPPTSRVGELNPLNPFGNSFIITPRCVSYGTLNAGRLDNKD